MNAQRRILIVDQDKATRDTLASFLAKMDCAPVEASSAAEAVAALEASETSVVLVDLDLPEMDGSRLVGEIKQIAPLTEIVLMTTELSADAAIRAIRMGAYDYFLKPFQDIDQLWVTVQRALEKSALARKNRRLVADLERSNSELSAAVKRLSSLIEAGRAMSGIEAIPELLDFFIGLVVSELDVDRASLMLLDSNGTEMSIVASRGISEEVVRTVRVKIGDGIAGWVAQKGKPIVVKDPREDPRFKDRIIPYLSGSFISSPVVLAIPIKAMERVLGVINVTRKRALGPFSDDDMAYVFGLAGQVAVALERAKHLDELKVAYDLQKKTQDQLIFSERLKALGQMAAGVAHDFNNILTGILGRTEVLLARIAGGELDVQGMRSELEIIEKITDQGAEAVRRIQDFTRIRKDLPNEEIDLNAIVRSAIDMTRPKWKHQSEARGIHVEIREELGEIPPTAGNANEITQVVSNLIFNAVEAMSAGGVLTFRTSKDRSWIRLEVSDTGKGMSEEVRARIFEPFYTTKDTGQGMGLSIVYGIVARYGGSVTVETEEGTGSTFVVTLPYVPSGAPLQAGRKGGDGKPFPPAQILIIEDDPLNRDLFQEMLAGAGHKVAVADGGGEGLKLFRRGTFDLVITDLIMPGMSGWEVAREVKRLNPDMPVIMLSGWSIQEEESEVRNAGVDFILSKPCSIEKLRESVERAISSRLDARTL